MVTGKKIRKAKRKNKKNKEIAVKKIENIVL